MPTRIGSIILEGATAVEDTIITTRNSGKMIGEGTLQDMDVENRNHRIYAKSDLVPEINGPRLKELIKARSLLSEWGHPLSEDLVRQQTIDPKLCCCRFNKVWVEGNLVKGQFEATNTEYGKAFDQDLREGVIPAFSLRALGSIENIGGKAYVKGIKVITWDTVIFPSHKAAYMDKIVTESAIDGAPIHTNQVVVPKNDPGTIITLTSSDARTVINRLQRESANLDKIVSTFDGIMDNITLVSESTVMLTSRFGEKFVVNLENHIENLIMDYSMRN